MVNKKKVATLSTSILLLLMTGTTVLANTTYRAPGNSSFKTFMDYRTVTNENSAQYQLREMCYSNEDGLRMYRGRYCVAIGSAFNAKVGTPIDVLLSTGVTIKCIVGDLKRDRDTDATNMQIASNGNVVEFIVDTDVLSDSIESKGTVETLPDLQGDIVSITVYDDNTALETKWENVRIYVPGLVIDKYEVVADSTYYFIDYMTDTGITTVNVSESSYNEYVCYKSIYETPAE